MTLTTELFVAGLTGLVTAIVTLSSGYAILIRVLNRERVQFQQESQEWLKQLIVCKDDLEESKEQNRKLRADLEKLKQQ